MAMSEPDIVIIGSGIGGATLAAGLAAAVRAITILERGEQLADSPAARDAARDLRRAALPARRRCGATASGAPFNPGNYYYVGGNSKFYGAVLLRYRARDFAALEHADGVSPAWPFPYEELEPWYGRGGGAVPGARRAGRGPDRAAAFRPLPARPGPGRAGDRARVRERLKRPGRAPVLPAARRRYRALAAAGGDALGRLPGHAQRQARRRDRAPGARRWRARRHAGDRRATSSA